MENERLRSETVQNDVGKVYKGELCAAVVDTFSTKNEVRLASKLVKKRLTKLKFNCTENVASLKFGLSR